MSGILAALAGIKTAIATAVDEYFNRVTLLLPGNGTNGAQNNTFLDSSSNNFTITRNGNTTQGTFSPFSQTGWSNYFDGTDDYLSIADNAVLRPGTSNFTLEAWIWRGASGAAHTIYAKGGASTGIVFQVTSTNVLRFTHTTTNIDSTGTISANAWTHVAVVREGTGTNQTKLYINGTQDGQGTVSTDFTQTEEVRIGTNRGATDDFNGYISNLRFVKGTALYTGTFTPSTTPLTTTSQGATATEVELLTCQSNRFVDNSSNAFAITVNGTPSVQSFSPFAPTAAYSASTNGGSGYFDGTGDYITTPTSSGFSFAGNFTIECWFYPTAALSTSTSLWIMAIGAGDNFSLNVGETSTIVYLGSVGGSFTATGNVIQRAWNHLAVVRNGSTVTLYINGVAASGTGTTSATLGSSSTIFRLGGFTGGITGYVSGWRIVNGSAVYTTAFTPPTAPPTAITNTQLLLNFTNAGITDATAKNVLETVGNAQISTTQSKWGGSSMYFDGTNSVAKGVTGNINQFGTGDFTVEMWVYPTAFANYKSIWCCSTSAANSTGFHIGANASGQMFIYSGSAFKISSGANSGVLTVNTWSHIAIQRNGSTIRIFVNGTAATSTWALTTETFTDGACLFGASPAGNSEYYAGYIDDVRITRGFARYSTSGFTPPTASFALQ